ncbi:MAG TPA: DUF2975 domain-containing protein [Cyclobacteriaceae bacterium]|nr:DUF2975 domain-containing protein [Cyclobacteriaceae bacterium]
MKIEAKDTVLMLKGLRVLTWIIFVGVCIEAGGSIFSSAYTLLINPVNASTYWVYNDLSGLYRFDPGHFLAEILLIIIASVLKAILFYLILMLLIDKKLSIARPFNDQVRRFLLQGAALSFGIGLFMASGVKYTEWLVSQGVTMPDTQQLRLGGADVWLFMGVILFIIAQIFKRGIEIQTENELTV